MEHRAQIDDFWDFYWDMRLQAMENLGKREAILAGSTLIRQLSSQLDRPVRVLELGCGEGQVIGTLLDAHAQLCDRQVVVGVDYNARSLSRCRHDFPGLIFQEGDFTDPAALPGSTCYDLLLLVNALHEVYSATVSPEHGEVDIPTAKERVEQALGSAARLVGPGGWLLLFDGLEPPGDPADRLCIRFSDPQSRADFETFAREYRPFHITYQDGGSPQQVKLSRRDFTRYLTKSIFLGKRLWETEREESYQYFTEAEFRAAFTRQGLSISTLQLLTVNAEKWRRCVELVTTGEDFPLEHILILAQVQADRSN